MGSSSSAPAVLPATERTALQEVTGASAFPFDDALWVRLITFKQPLHRVEPGNLHLATRNFCDRLARNNRSTRNLNTLLGHVLLRLGRVDGITAADALNTVNIVFLARTFLQHLVELDPTGLVADLDRGINPGATLTNVPVVDNFTARGFALALLDFVSAKEPNPTTHDIHLEVLNTLLVLMSSQLKSAELPPPPSMLPTASSTAGAGAANTPDPDPFLSVFMMTGDEVDEVSTAPTTAAGPERPGAPAAASRSRAFRTVKGLLRNFMRRQEAPAATAAVLAQVESKAAQQAAPAADGAQGGVLSAVGTAASTVIFLPWQIYNYLFPHRPRTFPVATRSAYLLLLLTHNCRSRGWRNPFRTVLCEIIDEDGDAPHDPTALRLRLNDLFASLCSSADTPAGTLLLYTLFHGNPMFMNFLLARTDLDKLLLPLLAQMYDADKLKPFQRYILLIVFLLFTQDSGFCDSVHISEPISHVAWFKDRLLVDVSLGSLILIMLLRTVQFNLTKLQDGYMHTTSFAALANMSPHVQNIHPYAAQRIVGVLFVLIRKYERLTKRLEGTTSPSSTTSGPVDEATLTASVEQYAQLLHILLEIIHACLAPRVLRHNLHLVYTLMHRRDTLQPLQTDPRFASLVEGVVEVLAHFQGILHTETEKGSVLAEEDVIRLLKANCQSWRGGADAAAQAASLADTKFTYDEEACPEDFFVPYAWALTVGNTRDLQWDPLKIALFPVSDAGLGDDIVDTDPTARGTPSPASTDRSQTASPPELPAAAGAPSTKEGTAPDGTAVSAV